MKTILFFLLGMLSFSCMAFNTFNNTPATIHIIGDKGGYEEVVESFQTSHGWSLNKPITLKVYWTLVCNDSNPPCPMPGTFIAANPQICELGAHKKQLVNGNCNGLLIINNTVVCTQGDTMQLICPK